MVMTGGRKSKDGGERKTKMLTLVVHALVVSGGGDSGAWWRVVGVSAVVPVSSVSLEPTTITAGRSDSGYSNTSSPRGSTLTLHPAAPSPPAADHTKLPR